MPSETPGQEEKGPGPALGALINYIVESFDNLFANNDQKLRQRHSIAQALR